MAKIYLTSHKSLAKSDDVASVDVSGIIGVIGSQVKGSMAFTFEKELATNIWKNMLGDLPQVVDDEVRDILG